MGVETHLGRGGWATAPKAFLRENLAPRKRRQEKRGKNRNDGDDHQQFNQRVKPTRGSDLILHGFIAQKRHLVRFNLSRDAAMSTRR